MYICYLYIMIFYIYIYIYILIYYNIIYILSVIFKKEKDIKIKIRNFLKFV